MSESSASDAKTRAVKTSAMGKPKSQSRRRVCEAPLNLMTLRGTSCWLSSISPEVSAKCAPSIGDRQLTSSACGPGAMRPEALSPSMRMTASPLASVRTKVPKPSGMTSVARNVASIVGSAGGMP